MLTRVGEGANRLLAAGQQGLEEELVTEMINAGAGDNPYIFGDAALDRQRLETQTKLFASYIRSHAREFCGAGVRSILDLGCGEGQLGFVLKEVYPDALLVGVDRDSKAIAEAQHQATRLGLTNTRFLVQDIEHELPDEQFDLIYCSVIMLHTRDPQQMVVRAYAALNPGGHLWVKDFDGDILTDQVQIKFLGGSNLKMIRLLIDGIAKIGGHPYFMSALPAWLEQLGAVNIRREREYYPVGGRGEVGTATLAIGLGGFITGLPLIARAHGMSEHELMELYAEVVNRELATREEIQTFLGNIIAAKPR